MDDVCSLHNLAYDTIHCKVANDLLDSNGNSTVYHRYLLSQMLYHFMLFRVLQFLYINPKFNRKLYYYALNSVNYICPH